MRAFVLFLAALPMAALLSCAMLARRRRPIVEFRDGCIVTSDAVDFRFVHSTRSKPYLWAHRCPSEGAMYVGAGEPCNWCGAAETD